MPQWFCTSKIHHTSTVSNKQAHRLAFNHPGKAVSPIFTGDHQQVDAWLQPGTIQFYYSQSLSIVVTILQLPSQHIKKPY